MSSIAISTSLQIACSSNHVIQKQKSLSRQRCSVTTKQTSTTHVVTVDVENKRSTSLTEHQPKPRLKDDGLADTGGEAVQEMDSTSSPRFQDERWKNGTWDLNLFVKDGKMDWDSVIVAEARRRKFLELYPEAATTEEPVTFRSSIIPWWAWIRRSHLPEAELLNGRAAMVGFFAAYLVDVLTGLNMVGQTGNFICKTGLLMTVLGIVIFRKKEDVSNLRKLVDEATFYDKQWQASWGDKKSKQ